MLAPHNVLPSGRLCLLNVAGDACVDLQLVALTDCFFV